MVKEPRPGRVKTRLGRDIGMVSAAAWYRQQTRSLLRRLRDPRWSVLLSVAPDKSVASRVWPMDLPRIAQGRGDLGVRMARALAQTQGPTLLIGSDIPGVRPAHIAQAFSRLRSGGSIIGPATDGGYWLVGIDHPHRRKPKLFKNVRWSGPSTLKETVNTLPLPVSYAETLQDVDTRHDLHLFKNTPGRSGGAEPLQ